jgi:KDO2-lipid IV(A) lauroyltransferase
MSQKGAFSTTAEYAAVKSLTAVASILPKEWIYTFMRGVSLLFYRFSAKRRRITVENLSHAFPELSEKEIERLSREVYTELSVTVTDILLMLVGRLDMDEMVENYDEALGKLEALRGVCPNGIIFMGAHFSNWELPPLFASKHGYPMTVIGRRGDNHMIDEKFVLPFRSRYGNQTVYKKKAGIAMLRTLKQHGTVGLLIDQKVNKENGFLVPFFGREAFTTHAVATLKLKADPAIIPISMPRAAKGKYRLHIGEAIEYRADGIEGEREKLLKMTERYNQTLEEIIRAYPAQWLWMHDRWNRRV